MYPILRGAVVCLVVSLIASVSSAQSWTTPRTWTTNELVTAAQLNTHLRDNETVLRAGGIAITSQAANEVIYATSSTQLGRSANLAFTGNQLIVGGTVVDYLVIATNASTNSAAHGIKATVSQNASTNFALAGYAGATKLFTVNGDGSGYLLASAWTYGSDRRLKEHIEYFSDGLNVLRQLRPARFDYIDGAKQQYGFVAQDVMPVIPAAVVVTDPETSLLGLKTEFILPYAVAAIQELDKRVRTLEERIH